MRNIKYNLRSSKKTKPLLDKINEDHDDYRKEAREANAKMSEMLRSKWNLPGNKSDEIIDVDEYMKNKTRKEMFDKITALEREEEYATQQPLPEELLTKNTYEIPKKNHFDENFDLFTKSSSKFSNERKKGDRLENTSDKIKITEMKRDLDKIHTEMNLHRSVHEAKHLYNLTPEEVGKFNEIVKNCGSCARFRYKESNSPKPNSAPSILVPKIPLTSFALDLFELTETEEDPKLKNSVYKYILGIVCVTSQFVWAYPLRTKTENECLKNLRLFIAHVACGGAEFCIDQDATLTSNLLKNFYTNAAIKLRILEKGGSSIVEVVAGRNIKRRIAATSCEDWTETLPFIVSELNIQRRRLRMNYAPFTLVYSKEADMDFKTGVHRGQNPQLKAVSIDYSKLQSVTVKTRSFNFNKHNITLGSKVLAKFNEVWDLGKVYKVIDADEEGVLLELMTIDEKTVNDSQKSKYQISRKWSDIRKC